MIVEQNGESVTIILVEDEYASIRIRRITKNQKKPPLVIHQDGKGALIVEYNNRRFVDERNIVMDGK